MDRITRLLHQLMGILRVTARVLRAVADGMDAVDKAIAKALGVSKKKESKEKVSHE